MSLHRRTDEDTQMKDDKTKLNSLPHSIIYSLIERSKVPFALWHSFISVVSEYNTVLAKNFDRLSHNIGYGYDFFSDPLNLVNTNFKMANAVLYFSNCFRKLLGSSKYDPPQKIKYEMYSILVTWHYLQVQRLVLKLNIILIK